MNRSSEIEVKVGIFVAMGVGLTMVMIMLLGGGRALFERSVNFHAKFSAVEGLVEGATVKVAGVRVGQVKKIAFIPDTAQVDVSFSVNKKFADTIRKDSSVGIQTQGVLGDRYIVVTTGSLESPIAESGMELRSETPKDFKDYLSNADEVLGRLKNSVRHMESILGSFNRDDRAETFFKNLTGLSSNINSATNGLPAKMKDVQAGMVHFRSVMSKIDNGQGTIGALINDPSLYDDVKTLLGGANRNKVLKYFIKKSVESSREEAEKTKKQ